MNAAGILLSVIGTPSTVTARGLPAVD